MLEYNKKIPFIFLDNQILVSARINDVDGNYFIDTGTSPSVIDHTFAKKIRLEINPEKAEGTDAQRLVFHQTIIPWIDLGGIVIKNIDAMTVDLSGISSKLGRPLSGILGYSFLKRKPIQIDYRRREISFASTTLPVNPNASLPPNSFRMKFVGETPLIDTVRIHGKTTKIILDTGSSRQMILYPAGVYHLGLEKEVSTWSKERMFRYSGEKEARKGMLNHIELGNIDLGPLEVIYEPSEVLETKNTNLNDLPHGSLGNALLKKFVLTLNYDTKTVIISRCS